MKKLLPVGVLILALAAAFILYQERGASAASDHNASFVVNQTTYTTDGQARAMDVAPFVEKDRTYVPLRYLAYALGIQENCVSWDDLNQSATLSSPEGKAIIVTVGQAALTVDGYEQAMDVPPLLREGRVFLPVRWLAQALDYEVRWDEANSTVLVGPPGSFPNTASEVTPLPAVGSYENLKDLLSQAQSRGGGFYNGVLLDQADSIKTFKSANKAESQATSGGSSSAAAPQSDAGYSKTNIQVEGVDEADIVKTDGVYIYQVNRERVVVAKVQPAADMAVVSTLDFNGKDFSPLEMYVDEKYLVVLGNTRGPVYEPMYQAESKKRIGIMPPYYPRNTVKAIIYNIEDKSDIKQLRELELNGNYVSSRKIGSSFYMVANQYLYYSPGSEIENPRPLYRDTAVKDSFIEIDYPNIKCFPDFIQPGYLVVAGLNLDQPEQEASVSSYLGSGKNIYASTGNLYVAVTGNQQPKVMEQRLYNSNVTKIYRFTLSKGRVSYAAKGEAPGRILNQFSMDEHHGSFRIATTEGEIWRTDEYTTRNNVFILDSNLDITGRLENIAPGEEIYSARFIGDRGYLVTFKTVDPFFVLDLKDPGNPAILGALKIPGYSDYLHPYDENHVIGFGKDTVELSRNAAGDQGETMAFYTGMKMALFDVTDVSNPVEMFRETIGDRGTDSELLQNHKALLFDKDKNLLAFPVRVMVVEDSQGVPGGKIPQYGTFAFQGAYVYNLDLAGGFSLKGKITHLSAEDYLKSGNYWYDSDKNIA
ncbi:MAG: beta-propeller domain-containing protein, partial [Desulfotomaculaceae bacterium]|nr:beta-propeller domain-containing protein [Desulfotomaculaceae bacterium]